jgi:integrase
MKRTRGLGGVYQRGQTWWIQFFVHGQRVRESAGSSNRADAVRLLKQRIGDVQAGKPVGSQIDRTTLADLTKMLLEDYRANGRRSIDRVEDAIKHLRVFFGEIRLAKLTSDRFTAYQVQRKAEGAANATVNYELAMLRRGFRLGVRAGKVAARPEFTMLHTENARRGFFEPDQYRAVLENLPDYLRPLAQAAYITGWRTKSELLTRQWRHVDLVAGWLRLDPGQTKNGEGRMFPLTPELRTLLEAQRERVRDLERATGQIVPWVFVHPDGTRIKNFRYTWEKACRVAGVPGRLVHDFRRTAVRNLERAGVPRSAAMKMTGHLTETVYRRYAIVDESMMREASEKLAALHVGDFSSQRTGQPKSHRTATLAAN